MTYITPAGQRDKNVILRPDLLASVHSPPRHEATCRLFDRTTLTDLQISLITGHRDPRMLRRYANLRGSDLAERLW